MAAAVEHVEAARRRPRAERVLRLRVRSGGRLRAARHCVGNDDNPPWLTGGLVFRDGQVQLVGQVRESVIELFWPRSFLVLSVLFGALAAALIANEPGSPGTYVCSVGAVLFAFIARLLRRPPTRFAGEADDLVARLARLLRATPDRTRPRRH